MQIKWKREANDGPIPDDEQRLLADIRARQAAIEEEAISLLRSRLNEGRRTPRRHMQVAVLILTVLMLIAMASILAK